MWVYRGIGGERAVGITFECLDIAGGRWGGGGGGGGERGENDRLYNSQ